MDLANTPDIYAPSMDETGNYIDMVPCSIDRGIICPCSSRKGKVYASKSKFSIHCKSKTHKKWIETLNHNKANHYVELITCKEVLEQQKQIIAKLENDVMKKGMTINYLTEEIMKWKHKSSHCTTSVNLIDFD